MDTPLLPMVQQAQTGTFGSFDLRQTNVFPLNYRTRLRYYDTIDLGVIGSSPVGYVFAANGLYDPDITGTGHQPMGFDQLSVFFQHHCVLNSTIRVTFANMDNATFFEGAVAVQRSSTVLGSYPRLIEAGNVVHTYGGAIAGGGGPPPNTISQRVNVAKWQGVPIPMDDDTLKGATNANPTTLIYFVVYAVGPVTTSNGHLFISAQLEYDAVFTEPFQPVQS